MLEILRLDELEERARDHVLPMAFDYIAGGADDEVTLAENRAAFRGLQLLPRVLVDTSQRDLGTTVLGTPIALPVLVAPMAFHALVHPAGELATSRATAAAGTIMVASTMATTSLEAIAAAAPGPRWFQLYAYKDRELNRWLIERAVAAGYQALCVTVDTPLVGHRERDIRHRFALPVPLELANFSNTPYDAVPPEYKDSGLAAYVESQWKTDLSWHDIDWLAGTTRLPIVLKGIMAPDDARLAVEHGVAAIVVSNHGGRQLDTVPAPITMLPRVVEAVQGACELLVDGGVRRGTDVLKALALGARAVLVGRPVLWGLALGGEEGVAAVLQTLRTELDLALVLAGCPGVAAATPALIASVTR